VRQVLKLATIEESDLNPVTQCLYSMQDHKIDDMILLEVDKHILEALNEDNTYVFFLTVYINIALNTSL
jgi:hypothetical protein